MIDELICPFCGIVISEEYDAEEDPDEEVYWEKIADHCANHPSCEKARRERRRMRYGY